MSFDTDEGYREPIATVNLRFTFKFLLALVGMFFLTIGCIYFTYKAYTDPLYFLNDKGFLYFVDVLFLIFFLTMGIPGSIACILGLVYHINFKCIEVYKNRVVQRARVGWLPPFNQAFEYKPEQIKVYESGGESGGWMWNGVYYILFSKNKNIWSSSIFQWLNFKSIIRFFTDKSQKYSFYRKDEVLALINFLLEKIEDKENIKKLEKFKGEVLKWK